jgi:hypothetical protein
MVTVYCWFNHQLPGSYYSVTPVDLYHWAIDQRPSCGYYSNMQLPCSYWVVNAIMAPVIRLEHQLSGSYYTVTTPLSHNRQVTV